MSTPSRIPIQTGNPVLESSPGALALLVRPVPGCAACFFSLACSDFFVTPGACVAPGELPPFVEGTTAGVVVVPVVLPVVVPGVDVVVGTVVVTRVVVLGVEVVVGTVVVTAVVVVSVVVGTVVVVPQPFFPPP
jgi:hypothetical protein